MARNAPAAPQPPRISYSINEVINATSWNRNRVYDLIAQGKLRTYCTGRRRYVSVAALNDCIRKLERETEGLI